MTHTPLLWCCRAKMLMAVVLVASLGELASVEAVEEATLFLNELRSRGYYDTANDYLEAMSTSDLADDAFKRAIPREQALSLASQAGSADDAGTRDRLLEAAIAKFQAYIKLAPDDPDINTTKMHVGSIHIAMAKAKLREADRDGADKEAIRAKARERFVEARKVVDKAEQEIQVMRKKIEAEKPLDAEKEERRQKLRGDWVRAELTLAAIAYEMSKTYEPKTDEYEEQLEKAAGEYEALFRKHRTRLPGLYSRLQQGRCLADKGDSKEALICFKDLMDQDDTIPQFRALKLEALQYAMESWIDRKKYDAAIKMGGVTLTRSERRHKLGLALQYFQAEAKRLKATTIQDPKKDREKKRLVKEAKNIYKALAKSRNEWQAKAKERLVALGEVQADSKVPKTFDDAFDLLVAAMGKRSLVKKALANATGDKKTALEEKAAEATDEAFRALRLALAMVDPDTRIAKVSSAERILCYLYYDRGDIMHAAVVGDYLSQQYPQSGAGKTGAWIAMNSFLMEYGNAWKDKTFETEQIKRLARRIVERWPDSNEATEARFRLVIFAVQDRNVDEAMQWLAEIPESSSRRGEAELTVGQSLWAHYSKLQREPEETRPKAEALEAIKEQARQVLADGLARMESTGRIDATLVGAAYSLAQLYAGTNKPAEAIALFENDKFGALTLVEASDPISAAGNYPLKTYRLALRSYVSALPGFSGNKPKQDTLLKKAMAIVEKLEKEVGTDDEAAARLTQIYIEMGSELEDQIRNLDQAGDKAGKVALSQAFEAFLDRIRKRPQGATYSSLVWIAETFRGLGSSNLTPTGRPTAAGKKYFDQAASTYARILANAEKDPGYIRNPRQRTTIEMRLASCQRQLGDYEAALDGLAQILERKQSNLTVQAEAAETLYAWAKSDCQNSDKFAKSILGDRPNPKTNKKLIWGWRRLAKLTEGNEKFGAYFFQSSLYLVRCRVGLARCKKAADPKKATKLLVSAKGTLLGLFDKYPELGGPDSKKRFDRTMKQIQRAMGEKPMGLKSDAVKKR